MRIGRTLSQRILLGLTAGILLGLFFGEQIAFLEWPAKAFVQLLGVTVLPYIVTSLVSGVARGTPGQARRLATQGGVALLVLWAAALMLVFLGPLALPPEKGGSFYATATVSSEQIDWLDLYIPANPFRALANNVVPAVVVFSALLGIALLGLPGKARILGPLQLVNEMLARAGNLLVALTPIGVFAIAGYAAGTLRVEEFERLQAYMVVSTGLSLVLTLWILPGLASVLTGLSYRRILSRVWDPLITAFVTANLFIVLPLLQERAKELLAEVNLGRTEADEAVDVLVPTSFTFPNSAKLLSIFFVLFAGWFAGAPLSVSRYPALAGAGVLSVFGSVNTAIPFLLDLVRLPTDLYQLFVVSSVVSARFGSAAAAMHTLALALLGASFMSARARVDKTRLLTFAAASAVIVAVFLWSARLFLSAVLPGPEHAAALFDRLRVSGAWGTLAPVETMSAGADRPEAPPVAGQRLDAIKSRGSLRVCVSPDAMPWCFINARREIVGFEVDVAHSLAVGLNVRLVLVPVERVARGSALVSGACDIGTARVVPAQAASVSFSQPLAFEMWAFLTPDHQRDVFASLDLVRQLPAARIAVFREQEWIARLKALLPNAEVVPVDSIPQFVDAPQGRFDAMFTGFDRAQAYSLAFPRFSAVIPSPDLGSIPLALAVPRGEPALLDFANAAVDVGTANGAFKAKLDYWVRGKGAQTEDAPRWSIGHNVLGWW